jgi:hypothetical protein
LRQLSYIYAANEECAAIGASTFREHAMRAEAEKLAEAIRQSLALLRRHL